MIQFEAFKDLKSKEKTKQIKSESENKNNQSITTNIFNDLIKKKKRHNE